MGDCSGQTAVLSQDLKTEKEKTLKLEQQLKGERQNQLEQNRTEFSSRTWYSGLSDAVCWEYKAENAVLSQDLRIEKEKRKTLEQQLKVEQESQKLKENGTELPTQARSSAISNRDCKAYIDETAVLSQDLKIEQEKRKKLEKQLKVAQQSQVEQNGTTRASDLTCKAYIDETTVLSQDLKTEQEKTKKLEQLLKVDQQNQSEQNRTEISSRAWYSGISDSVCWAYVAETNDIKNQLANQKYITQQTEYRRDQFKYDLSICQGQLDKLSAEKEKDQQKANAMKKNYEAWLKETRTQFSNCQDNLIKTENAVTGLKNEMSNLKNDLKTSTDQQSSTIQQLNICIQTKQQLNDNLQGQLNICTKEKRNSEEIATNLQEEKIKTENAMTSLKNEVSNLKKDLKTSRDQHSSTIEQLNICSQSKQQLNDNLQEKLNICTKEKGNSEKIATNLREEKKNCQKELLPFYRDKPYPGPDNYTRYAVARLGMPQLQNITPLNTELGSVVNDVTSFRYPISIPPCREVNGRRNIFIAVISAADNFEKRAIIRQTWANDLNSAWNRTLTGFAGFAFILGGTQDKMIQKKIEEENATNKDIIQIDMIDVYRNLPIKIAGLLNWLYQNCANFKGFILKVDDDIYVSVRTLEYYIHTHDPFSPRIFGNKNMNPYPVRGNNNF